MILAIDIETTGLNPRQNKIIGIGIGNDKEQTYITSNFKEELLKLIEKGPKLLTWNGSFDLTFIKCQLDIDLLPYLHADVMLMKHTTDENFPFGLKECAAQEFGLSAKAEQEEVKASIKANGGSAKEFYKADPAILAKYCKQDVALTYRLYNVYTERLEAQGLTSFFYEDEVMPLYKLVTIPMEQQGIRLDVEAMLLQQELISADIKKLEYEIQLEIAPYLSAFTTWFLNKDYPYKTNTGKPSAWTKKAATQFDAWASENTGYMFNLQSKHHLKKLFFDELKCNPLSKTPTGLPQVDDEFIQSVSEQYTWAKKLTVYNKLNKIKSTYIDRLLGEVEYGIWYPSFMQHRTVSGRFASDAQQLPRPIPGDDLVSRYTSAIRTFIIPRDGHKLVSADYEQLEPTIFSHVSGDKALQAIFNSGVDFYSEVAIRTEGLQGVSSDKQAPNYLGKVNKAARQKAKAYSLGIAYGMTAYKLKFEIDCDERIAEKLVQDYYAAFPALKRFMDASVQSAETLGYVKTQTGRIRHLNEVKEIYNTYGSAIRNDLELWKVYNGTSTYSAAKEARKLYKNGVNNAINFQIQGLAASIVNRAAISLAKQGLIPVCQVHDELVYDLANAADYCHAIKDTMERIMPLTVPLKVEPQLGQNYSQCK
jgi:DNA polymerase-1